MRILSITAGAGEMYCGSCLRDAALAAAMRRAGHDILFVPTYTPLKIEAENLAGGNEIFFGGINVYLRRRYPRLHQMTAPFCRLLDAPRLLRFASRFGHMTAARDLAELTISVLEGKDGVQAEEFERMIAWLQTQPRPDICVLPNVFFASLAGPLRSALGVPVVAHVSGEDAFIRQFPDDLRQFTRDLLREKCLDLSAIIAANQYYAEFMLDYLNLPDEMMRVAPLGIDLTGYPEQRERRNVQVAPVIGYLARIAPEKGLHVLAEAFRLLRARPETASCRLRVAGYLGGEHRGYFNGIVKDIRRWGFEDAFEYMGEPDREGKIRFFSEVDVFSVPTVYPEPKGLFVPEALAAGTPVVQPRLGCMPEWIESTEGGILVKPDDAGALADGLAELMLHPDRAHSLGMRGQRLVREKHSDGTMAAAMADLFNEVRERYDKAR